MNCRKCGRELRIGAKRCPYCGTAVPAPGSEAAKEFKWDLQGSSNPDPGRSTKQTATKPPRKIEWNTEKREKPAAGNTVRKTETAAEQKWKEPEEARQLFTFDQKHAQLQKQVNRKVDAIAADKPAPAVKQERRDDLFVLPEQMTMEDFSDLLGGAIVQDGDDVLLVNEDIRNERPAIVRQPAENRPSDIYSAYPENTDGQGAVSFDGFDSRSDVAQRMAGQTAQSSQSTRQSADIRRSRRSQADQEYDPFVERGLLHMGEMKAVPAFLSGRKKGSSVLTFVEDDDRAEAKDPFSAAKEEPSSSFLEDLGSAEVFSGKTEKAKGPTVWIDPGYTPEEEQKAVDNFQKLISAEESFFEKVNQFTFMSEEEAKKAEDAFRRREEISDGPDLSFGSLEEEYQQYRKENNIPVAAPLPGKKDHVHVNKAKPIIPPSAETAKDGKGKTGGRAGRKAADGKEKAEASSAARAGKITGKAVKQTGQAASIPEDTEAKEKNLVTETSGVAAPEEASTDKTGKKKPRELNININESSGTRFRVRTEEVDLSDEYHNLKNTQPVDLEQVKEGPKSVKVQVEVNNSAATSSVEVTRRADGGMVVRTEDAETGSGHTYSAGLEDQLLDESQKSFWEKSSMPATRMTLTDIIGEETQAFRKEWEDEEEKRRAEGLETVVHAPDNSSVVSEEEEMEKFEQFLDHELPDVEDEEVILTVKQALPEEADGKDAGKGIAAGEAAAAATVLSFTKTSGADERTAEDRVESTEDTENLSGKAAEEMEEAAEPGAEKTAVENVAAEKAEEVEEVVETEEVEKTAEKKLTAEEETEESPSEEAVEPKAEEAEAETDTTEESEEVLESKEVEETLTVAEETEESPSEEAAEPEAEEAEAETGATEESEEAVRTEEVEETAEEKLTAEEETEESPSEETTEPEAEETEAETGEAEEPEEAAKTEEVEETAEETLTAEEETEESPSEEAVEPEAKEAEAETGEAEEPEEAEAEKAAEEAEKKESADEEASEEEAAAASEETKPEKTDKKAHKKRAGRISFKYNKPEESVPEDEKSEKTSEEKIADSAAAGAGDEDEDADKMSDPLDRFKGRFSSIAGRKEESRETEESSGEAVKKAGSDTLSESFVEEETDADEEGGSSWDAARIMRLVIIFLIVAIIIEFAVIGVKLFAPNSQGAVFINRIEQSLTGEEAAYMRGPLLSEEGETIDLEH